MAEQEFSLEWRQALMLLGLIQIQQLCHDKCAEEWRAKHDKCNDDHEVGSPGWVACITAAAEDHLRCINSCPPKGISIDLPLAE